MNVYRRSSLNIVESASVTYFVFSLLLCLSTLPTIVQGPFGYGKSIPSGLLKFLSNFYPTDWFCYGSIPLVFLAGFRQRIGLSSQGFWPVHLAVLFFSGSCLLVARDLLVLHGNYAVEPPEASITTIAANLIIITAGIIYETVKRIRPRLGWQKSVDSTHNPKSRTEPQ